MTEPHTFALGGVSFVASVPIGGWPLPPTNAPADVAIVFGDVDTPHDAPLAFWNAIGDERLEVFADDTGHFWRYPDGVDIWVSSDGAEVRARGPAQYDVTDLATYLVGPIFGFLLRKRGHPALHATTLTVRGKTWAIVGPAGAGKSSLAAALVHRGASLVAEDVSPIRPHPHGALVDAGLPMIKLWPDSASRFGDLPLLTPNWEKRYLAAPTRPAQLDAVLRLDDEGRLSRLGPRDLAVAMVDNVYGSYALSPPQRADDLSTFADLAERVEGFALGRRPLDEMCEIVESAS